MVVLHRFVHVHAHILFITVVLAFDIPGVLAFCEEATALVGICLNNLF